MGLTRTAVHNALMTVMRRQNNQCFRKIRNSNKLAVEAIEEGVED